MSTYRNNNLSLASATTGRAPGSFGASSDAGARREPRPTSFAQAGAPRGARRSEEQPRPERTASRERAPRGKAKRAAQGGASRASVRPSSFMKYAADNRFVQAIYAFTTGATKPLFIAIVVVCLAVGLYGPVRDYYVAWRAGGILEQQVEIREGYNGGLKSEVGAYLTDEGVEDAVKEGETRIEVTGTDDASDTDASDGVSTSAEADEAEAQVAQEVPWHLKMLDAIFGFTGVDGQSVASTGDAN